MNDAARKNEDLIRKFTWEIATAGVHLERLHDFWAQKLGITGPQWRILMALVDLDRANGVPVNAVATMLHVDSSFVTTQSKRLEKKGFLRRKPSADDARVVQMSITDKTQKQLAALAEQQDALNEFVFLEFNDPEFSSFINKIASINDRLKKAHGKLALEL
jgi:DNA-binding MarR family transcriptional regulator